MLHECSEAFLPLADHSKTVQTMQARLQALALSSGLGRLKCTVKSTVLSFYHSAFHRRLCPSPIFFTLCHPSFLLFKGDLQANFRVFLSAFSTSVYFPSFSSIFLHRHQSVLDGPESRAGHQPCVQEAAGSGCLDSQPERQGFPAVQTILQSSGPCL